MNEVGSCIARRDEVSLRLNEGTIEKLEIAKAQNNLRMALAIIRDDFESVTPLVTINSTVHEAFDLRTANTLYKAGFNTVRDVANSTEGVLLTLPGFQSKTVADIIARVKSIVSQKADDQK